MRIIQLALGLILLALPALGYEIEDEKWFGPEVADRELHIISTTDTVIFEPLIEGYLRANPDIRVRYVVSSTQQVFAALASDGEQFDLAISSAMDLQMKLANDGMARTHRSAETERLPSWAMWNNQVFAFSQEPVVLTVSRSGMGKISIPRTREEFVKVVRDNPDFFQGRIGTYDPNLSGAGYLFATQDARTSDTYWRLSEVIGRIEPRLYGSTSAMISDLQKGKTIMAYNLLGSYASALMEDWPDGEIVELRDFTHVLLRTALVPTLAENPQEGLAFLDFLLSEPGQVMLEAVTGLPRIDEAALSRQPHLRPIRLDPGLLVYVDPLKRRRFLNEWTAAVVQP